MSKFEFTVVPNDPDLHSAVQDVLNQLEELGAKITTDEGFIIVPQPHEDLGPALYFHHNQISTCYLVQLTSLRNAYIFCQGATKLGIRLASLGWLAGFTHQGNNLGDYQVQTSPSCTAYYNFSESSLLRLEHDIEEAELLSELNSHHEDFARAGIYVDYNGTDLCLVLQENDPELHRRLNRRNVDRIIALARVWTSSSAGSTATPAETGIATSTFQKLADQA